MKAVAASGGGGGSEAFAFAIVGAHELVTFHGDRNFVGASGFGTVAAKNFPQTADADGRIIAGEGDDVLDLAADVDVVTGKEANAP